MVAIHSPKYPVQGLEMKQDITNIYIISHIYYFLSMYYTAYPL